jgi:hypothetical protein
MNAPTADELAESQATLNEYVAYMIMGQAFNEMRYADRAVTALLNFNQAAGFELCEAMPPDDANTRQLCARTAVNAVRDLDSMSRWDAARARLEAAHLRQWGPDAVPAAPAAGGAALVYLITHAKLGAAKVGIADTSGLRLAQHRRAGWQVAAVFSVAAGRAAAVEAAMLEGWRRAGMPSCLARGQMPQGGWTETVALGRLDLAAEVTRLCKLAVQQDARPSRSQSGRPSACGRQAS